MPHLLEIKSSIFRTPKVWMLMLLCATSQVSAQALRLPKVPLNVGMYVINVEVAATESHRQHGLMFRERLEPNEGMIFVFDQPDKPICMWMKNTKLPLSVAFLDKSGRIVNIEDMQPYSPDLHCASRPVRYALEMNQGWFKTKNIKAGIRIEGLPED